jgi:hypothetical protein
MGIYVGESTTAPTTAADYTWYKIKGETGTTGISYRVYIRFKTTADSTTILTTPADYMGIYVGESTTAPTTSASYIWYKIKGEKGDSTGGGAELSNRIPSAPGTASAGTGTLASRDDHVHALQTTISGNAGSASKLATPRTFNISGDAAGTAQNFDGTGNVTIPITLAAITSAATIGETGNRTLSFGNTFITPQVKIDAAGRVVGLTARTLTMPSAPSSVSLSSSTPTAPSSSGSAGSATTASRSDHSHPLQTKVDTITNQASTSTALKLWAGSTLPSSKSSDTLYFVT